ncbi:MAG: hypothetical protein ACOX9E_08635 [Lentisphaeria bacterium]
MIDNKLIFSDFQFRRETTPVLRPQCCTASENNAGPQSWLSPK